jgi:hypothetical protein
LFTSFSKTGGTNLRYFVKSNVLCTDGNAKDTMSSFSFDSLSCSNSFFIFVIAFTFLPFAIVLVLIIVFLEEPKGHMTEILDDGTVEIIKLN